MLVASCPSFDRREGRVCPRLRERLHLGAELSCGKKRALLCDLIIGDRTGIAWRPTCQRASNHVDRIDARLRVLIGDYQYERAQALIAEIT